MLLIVACALAACGDGKPSTCNQSCETQCGGGPEQNICFYDPIFDDDGCLRCFCTWCNPPDMAVSQPAEDLSPSD
jgi:hypothetical protein